MVTSNNIFIQHKENCLTEEEKKQLLLLKVTKKNNNKINEKVTKLLDYKSKISKFLSHKMSIYEY